MKRLFYAFVLALALVGCKKEEPVVDQAKLNQPENPRTWSPAGKMYVAPFGGKSYGFYVKVFSKDSILSYQSLHSDYSIDESYDMLLKRTMMYELNYPNVFIQTGSYDVEMKFIDTTQFTLGWEGGDKTIYTLVKKKI